MLQPIDFNMANLILKCDTAAIRAVDEVESGGNGFLKSGKLKILFEGHWFYKFTKGQWADSYPMICYVKWTTRYYLGGEEEYSRFNEAFGLNSHAAMLSTSWGRYQIMGFNYALAGYASVDEMVDDYKKGERQQLVSFCNYVREAGLDDELREHKWAAFAYKYNGASYQKNQYDIKLQNAYNKFNQ